MLIEGALKAGGMHVKRKESGIERFKSSFKSSDLAKPAAEGSEAEKSILEVNSSSTRLEHINSESNSNAFSSPFNNAFNDSSFRVSHARRSAELRGASRVSVVAALMVFLIFVIKNFTDNVTKN
ncbi:MAG: hypothetical protein EBX40_06465 [Gammaproteobacteria bacterium]|nr:hypothetical protein [Gammaproteobacteria bacterium]